MFIGLSDAEIKEAREKAHEISRIAMWDSLVEYYFKCLRTGPDEQQRKKRRTKGICEDLLKSPGLHIRKPHQVPVWKDIYVQSDVPEKLASLKELANNLWWSWNTEAESIFRRMDPSSMGRGPS